jgi:hypothetical protein
MAAHPDAPVTAIADALRATAKHPAGPRRDNRWGHGMIQPASALGKLYPAS